jgi:hypothetical protein
VKEGYKRGGDIVLTKDRKVFLSLSPIKKEIKQ